MGSVSGRRQRACLADRRPGKAGKEEMLMLSCTLLIVLLAALCAAGDEPPGMSVNFGREDMVIKSGWRPLLRYRHANVPFKPYVQELFTPAGTNILRDAPEDHLHHHALMFALGVNGASFWAETPACGKQMHLHLGTPEKNPDDRTPTDGLTHTLRWRTAEGVSVLEERRAIRAMYEAEHNATLLFWESTLTAIEGLDEVVLTGSHYYGLGMRFVESMDKDGAFLYAGDAPGEIVRGDERLTPGPWCAYTGVAEGRRVTVAMFDHPDNPRYPALWFTMQTPFAYLSATRNLWKEPMPLMPGEPVHFRHAIAVWDGAKDAATIAAMNERLLALWR